MDSEIDIVDESKKQRTIKRMQRFEPEERINKKERIRGSEGDKSINSSNMYKFGG